MIKYENKKTITTKITAKGIVAEVTDTEIVIDDPKEGKQSLLFDILKQFEGKEIQITISNVEEE